MSAVQIPLGGREGGFALVDPEDYPLVAPYRWTNAEGYATRYATSTIAKKRVYMHRVLIPVVPPKHVVDHANRNGLDNRRCNIRIATRAQNAHNCVRGTPNPASYTKGFRGVSFQGDNCFVATCKLGDVLRYASFRTPEEAARQHDEWARELYGEFARLNFPSDQERAS